MELTYTQEFAYEVQGNSAVIWRCFSRTKTAVIPEMIDGYPVTGLAPYAFSAHMDESELIGKLFAEGEEAHAALSGKLSAEGEEAHAALLGKSFAEGRDTFAEGEDGATKLYGKAFDERNAVCPALCGENLEELILPATVVRVGRYCFYNCQNLKKLAFTGNLRDWGSGAFTGCHRVSHLTVSMREEEQSTLKEVLLELPEEMCVDYIYEGGGEKQYARLIFPEFFEEGVENTPARILETHVHGSGLYYRNCFQHRTFDFGEYDSRFPYAAVQEEFEVLASIVEGRLRYPYKLSMEARERYVKYIMEHKEKFGRYIVEKNDVRALKWFVEMMDGESADATDKSIPDAGIVFGNGKERLAADQAEPDKRVLLEKMTEYSTALRFSEGVSYLMDYQHRFFKPKKKFFDL